MKFSRRTFLGLGTGVFVLSQFSPANLWETVYSAPPNLAEWLNANPNIRDSLTWLIPKSNGTAEIQPYQAWTSARRDELAQAFAAAWNKEPSNLPEVPKNLSLPINYPATVVDADYAWSYFKWSVAQSLALEIGTLLPWSIKGYNQESLNTLFDANTLYKWDNSLDGFRLITNNHGYFTPAPPDFILSFLKKIGAYPGRLAISPVNLGIESSTNTGRTRPIVNTNSALTLKLPETQKTARTRAISKLLDWSRYKLVHFAGDYTTENMQAHWQYGGMPPLSRVINGTVNQSMQLKETRHWTGGCYGTTGFLHGVLRAINIPVRQSFTCGHSLAYFPADSLYLSHSDDPYSSFSRAKSEGSPFPFPSAELLISGQQFAAWFGDNVSDRCKNIGRQTRLLAVKYLPPGLVTLYLKDKAQNKSHFDGDVYQSLKSAFTLAELEELKLWEKLEAKANS